MDDMVTKLRRAVKELLPEEVKDWMGKADQARGYSEVPIPQFLEEYECEGREGNPYPKREFEGNVNGVWFKIVITTTITKVFVNGVFLHSIFYDWGGARD